MLLPSIPQDGPPSPGRGPFRGSEVASETDPLLLSGLRRDSTIDPSRNWRQLGSNGGVSGPGDGAGGSTVGSATLDLSHIWRQPGTKGAQGKGAGPGHGGEGSTVGSAMFNLSNSIVGAGIMGLPSILKVLGIPLGLAAVLAIGLLSEYSLERLLKGTLAANAWSFGDLMGTTYGRAGRVLLRASLTVTNVGLLVVYIVIIGDVLCGSDSGQVHYPGLLEQWGGGMFWWNSRAFVVSVCAVTVIGPLVSLSRIDSLHHTSELSILLAVFFVVITIGVATLNLINGSIDWSSLRWLPPGIASPADVWQLFSVIPTIGTAFTCHFNLHPVLVELQPPREEKMLKAVRSSFALCTAVYCLTAFFGYLLFGEATYADVLANFDTDLNLPYSNAIDDAVRILYAVHLLLVFPVVHFPLRASLDALVFPNAVPLSEDKRRCLLVTAVLLLGVLVLSFAVPNIQFAFQFVGSAGAATVGFVLPGLVALSDEAGARGATPVDNLGGVGLVILGLIVMVTGLASNVHSLFVK